MREPDGSRLTLGHLVQEPVWIRCLRQHEGHRRRSSYGKKEDASLVGRVELGQPASIQEEMPLGM